MRAVERRARRTRVVSKKIMSNPTDDAIKALRAADARVHAATALAPDVYVTREARKKMALCVDSVGTADVERVQWLANASEGAGVDHFPSGYVAVFGEQARATRTAIDCETLFAGTVLVKLSAEQVAASLIGRGDAQGAQRAVHAALRSERAIRGSVLPDTYAGLFSAETMGTHERKTDYFVAVRCVSPILNEPVRVSLHEAEKKGQKLREWHDANVETLRRAHQQQSAQRMSVVANVLRAIGVSSFDAERAKRVAHDAASSNGADGDYVVENVTSTLRPTHTRGLAYVNGGVIVDAKFKASPTAMALTSQSLRVGPVLMRYAKQTAAAAAANKASLLPTLSLSKSDGSADECVVFPSSTGLTAPLVQLTAAGAVADEVSARLMSSNIVDTTRFSDEFDDDEEDGKTAGAAAASAKTLLLHRGAFRVRDAAWLRAQEAAGFAESSSLVLCPVAANVLEHV